jgi:WD40 repeat protein
MLCAVRMRACVLVSVWDLNQGQELCHLTGHTGSINALCVMPGDNKLVSCSVDHSTRVRTTLPPPTPTPHTASAR